MKLTIESVGDCSRTELEGVQVIDLAPGSVLMFVLPKDTKAESAQRIGKFLTDVLGEIPHFVVNHGSFDLVAIRPPTAS